MSGETEREESGWTTDTLKYLMDDRFSTLGKLLDERKAEQDKAVDRALASVDRRLEGMNEFRATLSDQSKSFITRQEYDNAHEALESVVQELKDRINLTQGNSIGKTQMWGYLAGAVGLLATVVVVANAIFARGA